MHHRRRARARRAPPPGCGPQRALVRPPGPASRRAPSRFVGGHAASARSRRLRTPGRVSPRLGGARLGPGPGPSCPCGVAPTGARSPAPGLRRPRPRPGPGGFRRPGASPRASEERASCRARGRAAHAGWPPRGLARQPPACAALSLCPVQVASDARARLPAPRRSVPQAGLGAELPMRGGPLGRSLASPRSAPSSPGRTASPPPSGSHVRSAGASTRQAVARPSVLSGCVLRLGRRRATRRPQPARFPWDGRPRGKTPPGYAAATARLMPRARLDATAHRRQDTAPHGRPPARAWLRRRAELAPWPPPEALPPCALRADPTRLPHTICSGTMRACESGGPPPLPFSGGEEEEASLLPSHFGRGGGLSSPPENGRGGGPPFSGGEERRARRPAGRVCARGRDWARHTCGREGRRNAPEPLIPIQAVII